MLALDDPKWKTLDHRGWHNGKRSSYDKNAPFVPEVLACLLKNPADTATFQNFWPYLCSEGTTWPAAYAAAPYVFKIAGALDPVQRAEHLIFIGYSLINMDKGLKDNEIMKDYSDCVKQALPLAAESALKCENPNVMQHLLASVAAFKGFQSLAVAIDDISLESDDENGLDALA